MSKILNYMVVSAVTVPKFQEKMNEAIQNGWQPFGSISTFQMDLPVDGGNRATGLQLTQAVVKYQQ